MLHDLYTSTVQWLTVDVLFWKCLRGSMRWKTKVHSSNICASTTCNYKVNSDAQWSVLSHKSLTIIGALFWRKVKADCEKMKHCFFKEAAPMLSSAVNTQPRLYVVQGKSAMCIYWASQQRESWQNEHHRRIMREGKSQPIVGQGNMASLLRFNNNKDHKMYLIKRYTHNWDRECVSCALYFSQLIIMKMYCILWINWIYNKTNGTRSDEMRWEKNVALKQERV